MHATDRSNTIAYGVNFQVTWGFPYNLSLGTAINIVENGHLVSRRSDFIIYSVEAEIIDQVVRDYGPCILTILAENLQ
jgi:hypothetical protein